MHRGRKGKICKIDIGQAYKALIPKYASALLGFHTFTGCDITGKFNGNVKLYSWEQCMKMKLTRFLILGIWQYSLAVKFTAPEIHFHAAS